MHVVISLSLKRSWADLCRPSVGFAVDFLRAVATLLLLFLHLQQAQMGVSENRRPQYTTPNSRIRIIRTPNPKP